MIWQNYRHGFLGSPRCSHWILDCCARGTWSTQVDHILLNMRLPVKLTNSFSRFQLTIVFYLINSSLKIPYRSLLNYEQLRASILRNIRKVIDLKQIVSYLPWSLFIHHIKPPDGYRLLPLGKRLTREIFGSFAYSFTNCVSSCISKTTLTK